MRFFHGGTNKPIVANDIVPVLKSETAILRRGIWRSPDALMVLLMLALALVFMLPGLPPARVEAPMEQLLVYPPWNSSYPGITTPLVGGDQLAQQLPWRSWVQQEFAAGRFPLWASAPLGGMPLFAHTQPGVLYPLHLLWILLPLGAGTGIIAALKLWLAGVGMWGLLRALRLHPVAGAFGALGFMFGTSLVNWLPWQNSGVYMLLPWMAWGIYSWSHERSRAALVMLAVVIACTIFGGHPETLFIIGLTMALWAVSLLVGVARSRLPAQIWGLLAAVVIGFGIGAVQLLPFLEAVGLSHELAGRSRPGASAPGFDASTMINWLLPRYWNYWPEAVLTDVPGPTFTQANGYVGIVALAGLLMALVAVARRQVRFQVVLPWLLAGIFSWLVVYDVSIGGVLRGLPGFKQSLPSYWILILSFSMLMLAAFGWDWALRRVGDWRERLLGKARGILPLRVVGTVLLVAGLGLLALHLAGLLPQPVMEHNGPWWAINSSYRTYWLIWSLGLLAAFLGTVVLWLTTRRWRQAAPLLLALLLLADLWRLLMPLNGTAPADYFYPETPFLRELQALEPTARILPLGDVLLTNTGLVYGFRAWNAQDPMMSERAYKAGAFLSPTMRSNIGRLYNMFMYDVQLPLAPLYGIRYLVSATPPASPPELMAGQPEITRVAEADGLSLWRIEGVPGFTYLSDNLQLAADERAAADWMKGGVSWEQVRSYVALVEAPASAVAAVVHHPAGGSPGGTDVLEYTPGHIRIAVRATRPALAVVAESAYPGWGATLDGQPVELLRVNYLSQGVVVPAGEHTVELRYEPLSFRYGVLISVVSAFALLGLIVWANRSARSEGTRTAATAAQSPHRRTA